MRRRCYMRQDTAHSGHTQAIWLQGRASERPRNEPPRLRSAQVRMAGPLWAERLSRMR
jgi:hypothetical protein